MDYQHPLNAGDTDKLIERSNERMQIKKMNKYSDILKAFSGYVMGPNNRKVDGNLLVDQESGLDEELDEVATSYIEEISKKEKKMHRDSIIDTYSYHYCNICQRDKPPRCHHCKLCGRCCLKFDHHCPVVGCCIGLNNYKYFWQMCIFTMSGCVFQDAVLLTAIYALGFGPDNPILFTIMYTVPTVFLFLCGIFGICMVGSHLLLVKANLTTLEWMKQFNERLFSLGSISKNYKDTYGDSEPS